jgi:thiol:disulfide interchange protein
VTEAPRSNHRLFLLVMVGLVLLCWTLRGAFSKELIPWRENYAAAKAESEQTGKPQFLYFTASWCGPCQSLKSTTWADPAVAAALSQYISVKLDIDEEVNKPLALKYHADTTGIPLFVVLDVKGNVVRTTSGAWPTDVFLRWLRGEIPLSP